MTQRSVTRAPEPGLVADSLVMTGRAVRLALRNPSVLILAFFLPLVLLLLLTASFGRIVRPEEGYAGYVDYSLPLFLVMGIAFATIGGTVAAIHDLHSGFDGRLRTMPVSPLAPLAGRIAGDSVRNGLTLVAVTGVGTMLGFRFTTGPLAMAGFFLLALGFGASLGWLALAIAVRTRNGEAAASGLNALFLVCSFLSTGLVPLADLPGWAHPFAQVNPVSVVVEAMRALAHGGPTVRPVLAAVAWIVVIGVGCGALALRGYRRRSDPPA